METTARYADAEDLSADARLARAAFKAAEAAAAAERMAKALKVVAAKIQTTTRRGPAAGVARAGAGTTTVAASAISSSPAIEHQPVAIFQEKKADVALLAAAITTKEAVASARIEQRTAEPRRLPVAPVPVAPTPTAQWPERRNGERLECSGDVEILSIQQGDGKVVRGKIRTLSLGGCYMETEAALEWGSRLAVVLKVDTLSLRTIAEVRTVKLDSKCWAGLEFAGMTAESYESLKSLIAARSAQNPMKEKALAQAAG